MGQRFQYYFKTTLGWASFHHQWCYGSGPLWSLRNVLEFNSKAENYSFDTSVESSYLRGTEYRTILSNLLSTDARRGYYHNILDLEEEMGHKPDPMKGDNNDGIVVCDFTKGIKYAFVNIDQLEGQYKDKATLLAPLSAETYASCYYKPTDKEWKRYGIDKNVKYINKHASLLTIEELAELFPSMYRKLMTERKKLQNPKNIPPLLNHLTYDVNKQYANELLKTVSV